MKRSATIEAGKDEVFYWFFYLVLLPKKKKLCLRVPLNSWISLDFFILPNNVHCSTIKMSAISYVVLRMNRNAVDVNSAPGIVWKQKSIIVLEGSSAMRMYLWGTQTHTKKGMDQRKEEQTHVIIDNRQTTRKGNETNSF